MNLISKKPTKVLLTLIGTALCIVTLVAVLSPPSKKFQGEMTAEFIAAHKLELNELFLTDKISDLIKYKDGYLIGEEYRSTILQLNSDYLPIRRMGTKGDGPSDFKYLGALQETEDGFAVLDRGHGRLVFMSDEGQIRDQVRSELLVSQIDNFHVDNNQLTFFVADSESPIVVQNVLNQTTADRRSHRVINARNEIHARFGNKGFIKSVKSNFLYFPPTQTTVELLDREYNTVNTLDLSKLDFLKSSLRRADNIYKNINNQTIRFYDDVSQDGDRFYLLAYNDTLVEGQYRRSLNHVIEIRFSEVQKELWVSRVIKLNQARAYSQLLVEGTKLLAFNHSDFTLDQYSIK